ncbi:MAG: hypothetical protein M1820_004498 [Bogoriella megaspora]|nr:MAG: hypothetical protein M1820_004498 [Bogoriella megaspora]
MATIALPFRFKAGGSGDPEALHHHHRSTQKQTPKSFKSRHATKSTRRELAKGKVEHPEKGSRKTPHQQIMSKFDRRNQAKQKRENHHRSLNERLAIFSQRIGAPRIVAVVPLHPNVSAAAAVTSINDSFRINETIPSSGWTTISVPAQRTNVRYMILTRDLFSILDACRIADYVIFVVSAAEPVDDLGDLTLTAAKAQGISNFMMAAQGLFAIDPPNKRPAATANLKAFMDQRFPEQNVLRCLDASRDCATIMQWMCSKYPKGVTWRDNRSWMHIEDVQWDENPGSEASSKEAANVTVTGVVRGRDLNPDRLVQVGDWGDYQIEKITAPSADTNGKGKEMMVIDLAAGRLLQAPTAAQDDLAELAPEDVAMLDAEMQTMSIPASERKGVLLDDHHYFDEDEEEQPERPKRMPRGTSKYQSAWYLGDVSDSGSDLEDFDDIGGGVDVNTRPHPADGSEGLSVENFAMTEAGPSEYAQSEVFLDPAPEDEIGEIEEYRAQRRRDAEDDLEFPDEIELQPGVLARERLARYRGLKNFRKSHWETEEDKFYEPEVWPRLLEVGNYSTAKNRFLKEALVGSTKLGTRVCVHLKNVPLNLQKSVQPVAMFSLLHHEHKHTCVNYSITLNAAYPTPLKSKEEMIVQCGPRRLIINPLFSQGGETPNDVHKFERYLHPGRSAIASFVGPLTWGATPALFFKRMAPSVMEQNDFSDEFPLPLQSEVAAENTSSNDLALIGTGTSLAPSTTRIIAKRIILTGHPYKIHKKLVTVRYMFFNPEDVHWFKALQLWTKRGRSGFIKESLGTHGYFKATFDAKINPMDAVGISLYKRMWPRRAGTWSPGNDGNTNVVEADDGGVMLG